MSYREVQKSSPRQEAKNKMMTYIVIATLLVSALVICVSDILEKCMHQKADDGEDKIE
jgi:hypothetical protein